MAPKGARQVPHLKDNGQLLWRFLMFRSMVEPYLKSRQLFSEKWTRLKQNKHMLLREPKEKSIIMDNESIILHNAINI